MNRRFILICTTLILLVPYKILGQPVRTTTATRDLGTLCEGETFKIGLKEELSGFHIKFGTRNCPNSTEPYTAVDKSENIQITGATPIHSEVGETYTRDGVNYIKRWVYTFKAERTGEINVTSKNPIEVVIPSDCVTDEESYILEVVNVFTIRVIPKPPTPTLTTERAINPNSVKFFASGCPTSLEGYDYLWNGTYCKEQPTNIFNPNNKDGTLYGNSGAYYRVLCSANGGTCLSEPSEFQTGLSYIPPDRSRVPPQYIPQIDKIENIKSTDSNPTYHNYTVETEVCDAYNDPNCNSANVFAILLSGNQFIAPTTSDMIGIGTSNNAYGYDNTAPVQSYK